MLLLELLNKPVAWTQTDNDIEECKYEFTLPDEREFLVHFGLDTEYDLYDMAFEPNGGPPADRYKKTGKGGELLIFSTVLDILLNDFIPKHPDSIVRFEASLREKNRISLYTRMLERYIKPPLVFKIVPKYAVFYIGKPENIEEYRG